MSSSVECWRTARPTLKSVNNDFQTKGNNAFGVVNKLLEDERMQAYIANPLDTATQEAVKELLSLSAKKGKLIVPYWLKWDHFTTQSGSITGGVWKVDGMMKNALYVLPQIMLIAFSGERNCSVQDTDLLNSKP